MMNRIFLKMGVAIFVLAGTVSSVFAGELTVAVSANVQYAFKDIKDVFCRQTGIRVKEVIGSSGMLAVQIENGAPFDVFLSADVDYPQALRGKNLTASEVEIYAYGALVMWTVKKMDMSKGLGVLTGPSINKIAMASPEIAPYGRQALRAMEHDRIFEQVKRKLVYGESVAQVNHFIMTQSADIGFTSKSSVLSAPVKGQGAWVEVDRKKYEPIAQGVVILKYAQKNNFEAAQEFVDFLFSKTSREIFENYGYVFL